MASSTCRDPSLRNNFIPPLPALSRLSHVEDRKSFYSHCLITFSKIRLRIQAYIIHQVVKLAMKRYIFLFLFFFLKKHHPHSSLETFRRSGPIQLFPSSQALNIAQKPIQFCMVCSRTIRVQADLLFLIVEANKES